jgi:two-component system C4-dicarboxylate transport sensor histidine kinase DctB
MLLAPPLFPKEVGQKITSIAGVRFGELFQAVLHASVAGLLIASCMTVLLHFTVGRHIASLLDVNRRSRRNKIIHADPRGLPQNEIGDLILAQEKLLFELEDHQSGLGRRLRNAEDNLIRAAKFTATGELTSTIVHDLRSPLASILGYTQLLQEILPPGPDSSSHTYLQRVQRAAHHIDELVKRMSLFARHGVTPTEGVSIEDCIADTSMILEHHFKLNQVDFSADIQADASSCWGNKQLIVQILVNLCSNSVDAMDGLPSGSQKRLSVNAQSTGDRILVSVRDTGPGVPEELIAEIFQPFFTTKSEGKGTGLGLASCRDIADLLHTNLDVTNLESGGACFSFALHRSKPVSAEGDDSKSEIARAMLRSA